MSDSTFRSYRERNAFLLELGYADYGAYLKSPAWADIKRKAFIRNGKRCVRCCGKAVQIHHSAYDPETLLGRTFVRLFPVCRLCHETAEMEGPRKRTLDEANAILGITGECPPVIRTPTPIHRAPKSARPKQKQKPQKPRNVCRNCGIQKLGKKRLCKRCIESRKRLPPEPRLTEKRKPSRLPGTKAPPAFTGEKAGGNRIRPEVVFHPSKFAIVSHPVRPESGPLNLAAPGPLSKFLKSP